MIVLPAPANGVVHLRFSSQECLCASMMRLQEFYESPYPEIRGHFFSASTFIERYSSDHGGKFTYLQDWNGFNVPGEVVQRFGAVFGDYLGSVEREIVANKRPYRYYLIATWRDDEVTHELAHAMFGLSAVYRARAAELVARLFMHESWLAHILTDHLRERGYWEEVMVDEMNAYLSEAALGYWTKYLGAETAAAMHLAGVPFRNMLAEAVSK